jgi:hypothetical protein
MREMLSSFDSEVMPEKLLLTMRFSSESEDLCRITHPELTLKIGMTGYGNSRA